MTIKEMISSRQLKVWKRLKGHSHGRLFIVNDHLILLCSWQSQSLMTALVIVLNIKQLRSTGTCTIRKRVYLYIIWILLRVLKEPCHGDLTFFGQNCPKLKLSTFAIHKILIEHKRKATSEFKKRKCTIIRVLLNFPRRGEKPEKIDPIFSSRHLFPSWPSAAQDTYVHSWSTSRVILNKTGLLFFSFYWYKYVFLAFQKKKNTKNGDIAPLMR